MNKTYLLMPAAIAVAAIAGQANAAQIISESFDYTEATGTTFNAISAANRDSGTGAWNSAWAADSNVQLADGLSYAGWDSSGKAFSSNTNAGSVARAYTTPSGFADDGTEAWFSALFEFNSAVSDGTRILFGTFGSSNQGYGFEMSTSGVQARLQGDLGTTTSGAIALDQTYLVIGKIEFVDGVDTLSIWVNPGDFSSEGSLGTATSTVSKELTTFGNTVYPRTQNGVFPVYDELRLGDSLADVTPVPEPSSLALMALGGLAMVRRRK